MVLGSNVRRRAGRRQIIFRIVTVVLVLGIIGLICIIAAGYWYSWDWTGLNPSIGPRVPQYQPGKTLWDWLQLLIIPSFLTIGAAWLATRQNHDREIAQEQHEHENMIALDNQREVALHDYVDKMSELLLERNLRISKEGDEVRNIATARTLTVLPNLDAQRKRSIVKFLHDAGLITKEKAVIDLMEADLSGADLGEARFRALNLVESNLNFVDLSRTSLKGTELRKSSLISSVLYKANLCGADLSETTLFMTNFIEADLKKAILVKADLTGAWLRRTDLREADLSEADLSLTKIENADLTEADLTGAKVTKEQLETVKSLKDAVMPDGSKHS